MPSKLSADFIIRLIIPTALMAAGLWYVGSLWNGRMREKNLILILPVVVAMVPFYFWVIYFEIQKFRSERSQPSPAPAAAVQHDHIVFMAVSVASVALFYLFGAVPATIISIFLGMFLLRIRRPLLLAAVPVLMTLVLWGIFVEGFGVRMPLFAFP